MEAALQASIGPWAWFRYISVKKSLQLQQGTSNAQRLDQGSSWASVGVDLLLN